jgi:hypothetical protein
LSSLFFKKLTSVARQLVALTPHSQIALLLKMKGVLKQESERPAAKYKTSLSQLHNAALSLAEGLKSNDANVDDIKDFIKEVTAMADRVQNEEDEEEKQRRQGPLEEPQGSADSKEAIEKFAKFKSLLPNRVKTFLAVRMPIVPITKDIHFLTNIRKSGLSKMDINGYPVLENQLVIGLDNDWMLENFKLKAKTPYVADAIKYVVEQLQEKTNSRWVILGQGIREGYVLWFWVAKHVDANRLYKASSGGHLKIIKWGFAFR